MFGQFIAGDHAYCLRSVYTKTNYNFSYLLDTLMCDYHALVRQTVDLRKSEFWETPNAKMFETTVVKFWMQLPLLLRGI